ncbi:MAG: transcriptional regulator, PadR-like family [Candidatus Adlerbacteria bacterium]|nr:transcriptional regulator, PadR-like family [Candidatus Adlerbacteria bacterium]
MEPKNTFTPLRNGLLEFVVLKLVAKRAVYAAEILEKLAATEFVTGEGTLYPLLSKLRRDELVEYEWQESDAGPPRKYYRLAPKGTAYLQELESYWARINQTIKKL